MATLDCPPLLFLATLPSFRPAGLPCAPPSAIGVSVVQAERVMAALATRLCCLSSPALS